MSPRHLTDVLQFALWHEQIRLMSVLTPFSHYVTHLNCQLWDQNQVVMFMQPVSNMQQSYFLVMFYIFRKKQSTIISGGRQHFPVRPSITSTMATFSSSAQLCYFRHKGKFQFERKCYFSHTCTTKEICTFSKHLSRGGWGGGGLELFLTECVAQGLKTLPISKDFSFSLSKKQLNRQCVFFVFLFWNFHKSRPISKGFFLPQKQLI